MAKRGPKPRPRADRFWARVHEPDENGCRLWRLKPIQRGGYGTFYDDDARHRRAHRVAWELARGPVPDGLHVCHECDVPLCVNPEHLFLGEQADNLTDMRNKRRENHTERERGTERYNAKLNDATVRWIRGQYESNAMSIAGMARQLGVTTNCVGAAARRETWKHVP